MSNLISNPASPALSMKDKRLVPGYQVIRRQRDRISERHSATAYPGGFSSDYWPGNLALSGGVQGFVGEGILEGTWSRIVSRLGHGEASRVGFVGVTRDQYGAPTGSCVVQLFRTSDDLFIMEITSDALGNFLLQSWFTPDTHYIVAYKAGSPDIFGTTLNTLVGA